MSEQTRSDTGTRGPGASSAGIGKAASSETCPHCGQPLSPNRSLEQLLARIGISEEMIRNLKSQMQNVDVEQYLDTAREYLRNAGDKVKPAAKKAQRYAKENPGKIAAGVAVLALGAGLLLNSLREKE